MRFFSTQKLAEISAKKPWTTVFIWFLIIIVSGFVITRFLESALTTEFDFSNQPPSKQVEELIQERFGESEKATEIVIVKSDNLSVRDREFEQFVTNLTNKILDLDRSTVSSALNYYLTRDPSLVSTDQKATLIPVVMAGDRQDALENIDKLEEVISEADGDSRFEILKSGVASSDKEFQEVSERDLQKAEIFGVPVALLVLIVVFGAIIAAIIPVFLAFIAIGVAIGISALVGQISPLSFFVTNMITMMGLAVGIDYSLFIISRFREERAKGAAKLTAISNTGATANRAILFSGMTVILALLGLLIVPMNVFRSLSLGAIFVVIIAVFGALSFLPALLSILGDKINFLKIPIIGRDTPVESQTGFWYRLTELVMSRPIISLMIAATILILAAIPAFQINTGAAGVDSLPDELKTKRAFTILQEEFTGTFQSPMEITVDGDVNELEVLKAIARLQNKLKENDIFGASVVTRNGQGDLGLITAPLKVEPTDDEALEEVERLRNDYIPESFRGINAEVLVGGAPARNYDFIQISRDYTIPVFVFVLGLSFILLTLVFRSLVIPIKAIIMNLLSVGAAYGLMVLVTQMGFGADLLGFQKTEIIEAWIPIFLFSILFGLSMDYHVFLLSRIREQFDKTKDNRGSVAFGLASTGSIITGAALIMVAVFGAFAAGDLTMFQQFGFGLAVSIFLDATIVRSILVPATMRLLGDLNWYFPSWLSWVPNLSIEGEKAYYSEGGVKAKRIPKK